VKAAPYLTAPVPAACPDTDSPVDRFVLRGPVEAERLNREALYRQPGRGAPP